MKTGDSRVRSRLVEQFNLEPEMLFLDGHDSAIVGVLNQFGRPPVVLYNQDVVLNNLMKDGMTHEEAQEYFDFNIIGGWLGDFTPAFVEFSHEANRKRRKK